MNTCVHEHKVWVLVHPPKPKRPITVGSPDDPLERVLDYGLGWPDEDEITAWRKLGGHAVQATLTYELPVEP